MAANRQIDGLKKHRDRAAEDRRRAAGGAEESGRGSEEDRHTAGQGQCAGGEGRARSKLAHRHSGAMRSIEPGISRFPGLVLTPHPGMTESGLIRRFAPRNDASTAKRLPQLLFFRPTSVVRTTPSSRP